MSDKWAFIVRSTYVEIYNEEIYDLLNFDSNTKVGRSKVNAATLREEKDGNILLCGVNEHKVETGEELALLLDRGSRRRSTAATNMNDSSSRSHAMFTLILERQSLTEKDDFVCSRFCFVDLAGSERLARTGARGSKMREGININKGLLALGNVIAALTDDTGRVSYIPYRESKLTRILRNSLGGNSKTWMIACISPVLADMDESLNTLKYACRARKISNTPIINKDPQSAQIALLKKQIYKLQSEVNRFKRLVHTGNLQLEPSSVPVEEQTYQGNQKEKGEDWKSICQNLQKELLNMKQERNQYFKEMSHYRTLYCQLVQKHQKLKTVKNVAKSLKLSDVHGEDENGEEEQVQSHNGIEGEFSVDEDDFDVEKILKENESLKKKLEKKQKYLQDFQDEYMKLLKTSTQENELLVQKTKDLTQLQQTLQLKQKQTSNLINSPKVEVEALEETETDIETETESEALSPQLESHDSLNSSEQITTENENIDVEDYELSKVRNNQELNEIMESLQKKEEMLEKLMNNQIEIEMEHNNEMDEQVTERLLELEMQLQKAHQERDKAVKDLETENSKKSKLFRRKVAKTNLAKQKDDSALRDYKLRIDTLQSDIKEYKKRELKQKRLKTKVDTQKGKISTLKSDIKRMKQQKLDITKKMRDEAEKLQKANTKKAKELFKVKKKTF